MNNSPQAVPDLRATAEAKRGALINLASAVVQFDVGHLHPVAQKDFAKLQGDCVKILQDVVDEYTPPVVSHVNVGSVTQLYDSNDPSKPVDA